MKCRPRNGRPSHRPGYTLIEVLLVIAILGVIMAMVVPQLMGRQESANVDMTKVSIKGIEQGLDMYSLDHRGAYPGSDQGLDVLLAKTDTQDKRWRGPYLKADPVDPWGNRFRYDYPGKKNPQSFDVVSAGPDQVWGTADDIGNWEDESR